MTFDKAISIIKTELECVNRQDINCDRDCKNCDLLTPTEDVVNGMQMAIEALEKQNIKPVYWDMQDSEKPEAFCPTCKRWLDWDAGSKYCPYCGQKLSWEVEKE